MKSIYAFVLTLFVVSCAPTNVVETPAMQLAKVELATTEVIEQLVMLRNDGTLADDEVWTCVQAIGQVLDQQLDAAHAALRHGQGISAYIGSARAGVRQLRKIINNPQEKVCVEHDTSGSHYIRRFNGRRTVDFAV